MKHRNKSWGLKSNILNNNLFQKEKPYNIYVWFLKYFK